MKIYTSSTKSSHLSVTISKDSIKLNKLKEQIESLLHQIQKSDNVEQASTCFEKLNQIQIEVAKLLFKDEIKLPKSFKKFVKDFDRADDIDMRSYLFKKIKNRNYSLLGRNLVP